jgi:glucose-6-phosphate-specific signal transduction histidine kinase
MSERYAMALGKAVIEAWGELPQEVQQALFEKAVVAGHKIEMDESLREQLATFLHDIHPRTADNR